MGLRPYQEVAVRAGLDSIRAGTNGILVLPTGSGKSHIIASIAASLNSRLIVLQPSKEILEQNYSKLKEAGQTDIGIYSASCGQKFVGKITLATIGSVINKKELFESCGCIIVDECHRVNSKEGQYREFLEHLGSTVIGLTATPYRLRSTGGIARSQILTRTRPRIFDRIMHVTQIGDLVASNHLCKMTYFRDNEYHAREIKSNSTGQGYDDEALRSYNERKLVCNKIAMHADQTDAKHILIFTQFRSESEYVMRLLANKRISCAEIAATTPTKQREQILSDFQAGRIRAVVNVEVLSIGYDFPALDCVIIGKPTKSVCRYYQEAGRGFRPHPEKSTCQIIDLCDNVNRFGMLESFRMVDPSGRQLWRLRSDTGYQTGIDVNTGLDLEKPVKPYRPPNPHSKKGGVTVPFGKYKGHDISTVDIGYVKWCIEKFEPGAWRSMFMDELSRRDSVLCRR